MDRHWKEIIDLFARSGRFKHVFRADGFVFVANKLNALTAFCQPSLRKRDHQSALTYDYGLTVLPPPYVEADLVKNLGDMRRYVALPRTTPPIKVFDMFVEEGRISD